MLNGPNPFTCLEHDILFVFLLFMTHRSRALTAGYLQMFHVHTFNIAFCFLGKKVLFIFWSPLFGFYYSTLLLHGSTLVH